MESGKVNLPNEIIRIIFEFIPYKQRIKSASRVCKTWNFLVRSIKQFPKSFTLLKNFGPRGSENGKYNNVKNVAVNNMTIKNELIYVSDFYNHRIQVFDEDGNFKFTFGSYGNGDGQFKYPMGIAIDHNENIYVCDYNNHRIQIFDKHGQYKLQFYLYESDNGINIRPRNIAVDNNRIYIGTDDRKILIYNHNVDFVMKIELGYIPTGIAINPSSGYIITSDNYQHQLSIYDSNGNILSKIGSQGEGNGKFNYPCGIAISNDELIYVADYFNNRIQILTNAGEFITQITNLEGNIFCPDGVAVMNNGNAIVADYKCNQVHIYQPDY